MTGPGPYVPRPADLEGVTLRELADAYRLHVGALVNARYGIGRREPVGRLRSTALDALAVSAAAVEQLARERWSNVADALSYGAPVVDVAAAMGLEPVEVAAGLRSWADGQHEHTGMSADERDRLYALVDGVEVQLAAAVAVDDALVENLRAGGGAPDSGDQVDEMLARWVLESRRGEQADGEDQR